MLSSAAGGGAGGGASGHSGAPGGPSSASSSTGPSPAPFVPSMALRLLPELRCCPVLLVKYNSRGPWLAGAGAGGGGGGSMRVMVDLQANSRWVKNAVQANSRWECEVAARLVGSHGA